jgi:hypothetical protein
MKLSLTNGATSVITVINHITPHHDPVEPIIHFPNPSILPSIHGLSHLFRTLTNPTFVFVFTHGILIFAGRRIEWAVT